MYRNPSPGPSFAVRMYRSPSKAKAQTAIHSHGPFLAVRLYRNLKASKFKNTMLYTPHVARGPPEGLQKSGVTLFRGIFELLWVDRRGKNTLFLNFEVHGLRYIRTAKKGPYECIAVRAPRRLGLRYIRTARKGAVRMYRNPCLRDARIAIHLHGGQG